MPILIALVLLLIGLPARSEPIQLKTDFTSQEQMDLWVFDLGWQTGWGWVTVYGPDRVLKYRFWKAPTPEQNAAHQATYGRPIIPPLKTFARTPEEIEASGGAKPLAKTTLEYESYESFKRGEISADDVAREKEPLSK